MKISKALRLCAPAIAAAAFCLSPLISAAADPGSNLQTIYVVNMQRVIDQSIIGKAARADLQEEIKKRESKLDGRRVEIQKMNADLQKQVSLLAESALTEKREAIRKKERALADEFEVQKNEMAKKTEAQMKTIISQIDSVLSDFMKSNADSIVVEQDPRLVVYVDPKFDITEEIVKLLNDKKMKL